MATSLLYQEQITNLKQIIDKYQTFLRAAHNKCYIYKTNNKIRKHEKLTRKAEAVQKDLLAAQNTLAAMISPYETAQELKDARSQGKLFKLQILTNELNDIINYYL